MRDFSQAWYEAWSIERFTEAWSTPYGPQVPILPFITHPVPPYMREVFAQHGEVKTYAPGESLCNGPLVKSMQIVQSGVSCRIAATLDGQTGAGAMGLSAPNRFAVGNLNFATHRPQIGQYVALSKVTTREITFERAQELGYVDAPHVMRILLSLQEITNLSDRMALIIIAMLSAHLRFEAFLLSMSVFFGQLETGVKGQRVRIPTPGRSRHIANVISVSDVTLDKLFSECRTKGNLERDGDFLVFDSAILQEVHDWMRATDGQETFYTRPVRVEAFLEEAVERTQWRP